MAIVSIGCTIKKKETVCLEKGMPSRGKIMVMDLLFEVPEGDMELSLCYRPEFEDDREVKVWLRERE